MARLRYNGLATTLGGTGLAPTDTAVTFAAALAHSGGTAVPTIAGSDYIPFAILDSTGGVTEIVYLTAYTSGATTGTITRGQEGTTGVAHAAGDKAVHGPTVADLDYVGPSKYLELVPLTSYGNSYPLGSGSVASLAGFAQRVSAREHMTLRNRAVGGHRASQTLNVLYTGQGGTQWTVADSASGTVTICATINDIRRYGTDTAGSNSFKNSLGVMLAYLSAGAVIDTLAAAVVYTGTWATVSHPYSYGGNLKYSDTNNDYATITFSGTECTAVVAVLSNSGLGTTKTGPTVEYRIDGTLVRTKSYANEGVVVDSDPSNAQLIPERFTGLAAGSHTLQIKRTAGGAGTTLYFDTVLTPATAPPKIFVMDAVPLATWNTNSPYNNGSDALVSSYNSAAATIISGFANAVQVTAPSWDKATMIAPDQVHPNDKGHAYLAGVLDAAIQGAVPGWTAGVHSI